MILTDGYLLTDKKFQDDKVCKDNSNDYIDFNLIYISLIIKQDIFEGTTIVNHQ